MSQLLAVGVVGVSALSSSSALAEDWTMKMTVDNQFAVYFGTNMATNYSAGGGNNWGNTYTINATGRAATDYLYVATASDYSVSQGFIGQFTNTTRGTTVLTGAPDFQVFAAGQYLQQLFGMSGAWPVNIMPTQAQVDAAIAFATTNGLWTNTDGYANWDNRSTGNITTWGHRPGISDFAQWIWHNTPGYTNPFTPGADHDEFLVFRINGVPAPGVAGLLGAAAVFANRRRRAS
jgi:hypothetical protein